MDIIENATGAAMFYDRIAKTYGLTFRFNRYNHSLEQYLSEHLPSLAPETRILDAGCGTGLLTKALLSVIDRPVSITGLDLSAASISLARQAVSKYAGRLKTVSLMQGNILSLPFADNSFELVVTCGAPEYVPLPEGLAEIARVISPGGHLVFLPVKPGPVSKLLEVLYRFRTPLPAAVIENTSHWFTIIEPHHFPPAHPTGWTKTAILAQKKD